MKKPIISRLNKLNDYLSNKEKSKTSRYYLDDYYSDSVLTGKVCDCKKPNKNCFLTHGEDR